MLIWTTFSAYEVDGVERRVRRVLGDKPPTERTGTGWRSYREIQVEVGKPALILWEITADGVLQTTVTSNVIAVENLDCLGGLLYFVLGSSQRVQ